MNKHLPPGAMTERKECLVEATLKIFTHLAKYHTTDERGRTITGSVIGLGSDLRSLLEVERLDETTREVD